MAGVGLTKSSWLSRVELAESSESVWVQATG